MRCSATRCRRLLAGQSGFSIVEMLIVMTLMIVVLMISSGAFEKIAKVSAVQVSSSESNIQGIVGLEIMRADLEQAGFGLPWNQPASASFVANFNESQVPANALANGVAPQSLNDASNTSGDLTKTPRAIQSTTATGAEAWENGRDYLVIKGTSLALNPASKHWSYLDGIGDACTIRQWGNSTDDVAQNDRVITLRSTTQEQKQYRELVAADIDNFSYPVPAMSGGEFKPVAGYRADSNDLFTVYGVSDSTDLKFPYNRVDFYIRRPSADRTVEQGIPSRCAPGTGILYKGNLRHSDQLMDQYPLLDCVADMQVVYSLDTNGDGGADLREDQDVLAGMTSEEIRDQLKEIRVYILTHEGGKDQGFNYPTSTVRVGGFNRGRDYNLAALDGIGNDWKNYRWKIYTIVAEPKNINN